MTRVVGCVVTYHPTPALERLLAALRPQVQALVVVDNGSPERTQIEALAHRMDCHFAGAAVNRGMAAALNEGVALARELDAEWLATFDQDSEVPPTLIAGLLEGARLHPQPQAIGILCPAHRDTGMGRDYLQARDILVQAGAWRELRAAITSGSLVRMTVFSQAGLFDESLFIDGVDHDLCLRARRHGWRIVQVPGLVMPHALGAMTSRRLAGVDLAASHHGAPRRYYMVRNQLEVSRRYLLLDPVWSVAGVWRLLTAAAAVLVFEDDKTAKFAAMARGALHFAMRRFGPRS